MSQADERSQESGKGRAKEPAPVNTPTTVVDAKPRGRLTVQLLAMPADTTAYGDIFGSWVVSQMDIACDTARGDGSS